MNTLTQINAPFNGAELPIVDFNHQPYVPMKPIVEGMGLAWQAQYEKLKQRFESTIMEIMMVAADGKERLMICLPLRKLFGWLMTISPNKVKPELRDKVIMYQNECDDVLWDYWMKGQATKPQQIPLLPVPLQQGRFLVVCDGEQLTIHDVTDYQCIKKDAMQKFQEDWQKAYREMVGIAANLFIGGSNIQHQDEQLPILSKLSRF